MTVQLLRDQLSSSVHFLYRTYVNDQKPRFVTVHVYTGQSPNWSCNICTVYSHSLYTQQPYEHGPSLFNSWSALNNIRLASNHAMRANKEL